jgi:hypothetical protein
MRGSAIEVIVTLCAVCEHVTYCSEVEGRLQSITNFGYGQKNVMPHQRFILIEIAFYSSITRIAILSKIQRKNLEGGSD